jgi:hypothetical protein
VETSVGKEQSEALVNRGSKELAIPTVADAPRQDVGVDVLGAEANQATYFNVSQSAAFHLEL